MNLVLDRNISTVNETLGKLAIDNNFFGYTLELPEGTTKQQGINSGKIICIPKGQYKVKVTFSDRMQKRLPLIYNNDDYLSVMTPEGTWVGVRFHGGNTYLDSLACVLVAKTEHVGQDSSWFDKSKRMIRNWIQGSLADDLTKLLDDGKIHDLTIQ